MRLYGKGIVLKSHSVHFGRMGLVKNLISLMSGLNLAAGTAAGEGKNSHTHQMYTVEHYMI
jgi:hypothetical protein